MSGDLYTLALGIPWQMTAEALEACLSIAARDPLPEDEIARRMHGPKALALRSGQRRDDSRRMTMQDGVAIIPIDGPIYRYADVFTSASGGVTTESLALDFGRAMDDPAIAAVLFVANSPGGEVTGVGELASAIYQARGRKPIGAYVEGYGASATYRLISGADVIIADPDAKIGSIGTIMGMADPTGRPSYRIDFVSKQSPKKRPDVTTDEGRAIVQAMVDRLTDVFVAQVALHRGMSEADVLAIEGGMLIGQDAVDAGLADQLGSEESAIRMLAMGAIPTRRSIFMAQPSAHTPQEVPMPPEKKGFWGWIAGEPATAAAPETPTAPALNEAGLQFVAAQLAPQQPDPQLVALRAEITRLRGEQIAKDAAAFAAAELSANRAHPAEQDALTALYAQLAADDAASPIAHDGTAARLPPSRVALLQAATTARPAHTLSKPALPSLPRGAVALTNPAGGAADDAAGLDQAEASARAYAARANGKATS
jgi:ClpP class serine protease